MYNQHVTDSKVSVHSQCKQNLNGFLIVFIILTVCTHDTHNLYTLPPSVGLTHARPNYTQSNIPKPFECHEILKITFLQQLKSYYNFKCVLLLLVTRQHPKTIYDNIHLAMLYTNTILPQIMASLV